MPGLNFYSAVGEEITHYGVDVDAAILVRTSTITLPASVQYAWRHASHRSLYVCSSDGGPSARGKRHYLTALRIAESGDLEMLGDSYPLPYRPIHVSLDATGSLALIAYNKPSRVTVHRITADGRLGSEVRQPGDLDFGHYAHQICMLPTNRAAVLVTRGNDRHLWRREEPGALKVFDLRDAVLANRASIAPAGGYGFGPRHLDFHPTQPWAFVSVERQNQLHVYRLDADTIAPAPTFVVDSLARLGKVRPKQMAGAIHVHPNGRFVYLANRSDFTVRFRGRRVAGDGDNSLAVFAIDSDTGRPTLIQSEDARGFHVRTFAIDPSGRLLIAASLKPVARRDGERVVETTAGLSVFRIGEDGRLDFVRRYEIETKGKQQFWAGL